LAQVFGNLVSNAIRHTPHNGQIILSATQTEGEVRLHVADTGSGIAADDLPFIFDRFYRADSSRAQMTGESGLGLAIARSLVEAHGGRISVESSVGAGTTFTVALPAA
jgi:two-component system sensor histidine kinase BaeS